MKKTRFALQLILSLAVLGGAGVFAFILFQSAPETVPEDKQPTTKIVQVIDLIPTDERILVSAWGEVIPAREVVIQPQVSGRVMSQHESLVPGGSLSAGEEVVRIDPADYEIALIEMKAEMEEALSGFEVEKGRQIIAKREWEQLKDDLDDADINPSLALREPQLRLAEALVTQAKNEITKAELDLERTRLVAPFNSMVIEESVEVGQLVRDGGTICRLVGTDEFWVRATLPVAELTRIRLPANGKEGAHAEVYLDTGSDAVGPWDGSVIRLLSDLEKTGRMARILVEVKNPLASQVGTPLLLGSYVRVDIEAGRLNGVLTIPRTALREGNQLWLVGEDEKIRIEEPEILWTLPKAVLVKNSLKPGEKLIVSELKAAVPGMIVNPQPFKSGAKASEKP